MGGLQGVLLPLLLMVDDGASWVSFEVVGHQTFLPVLYEAEEDCDEQDQHHGHKPDHQAEKNLLLLPLLLHLVHLVLCSDHLKVSCLVVESPAVFVAKQT